MASYVGRVTFAWRGPFTNREVNQLHAEAFGTRVYDDNEWNWQQLTQQHCLGWVSARRGEMLVGFVSVLWDGLVHAWIQDVMVLLTPVTNTSASASCTGHGTARLPLDVNTSMSISRR